MKACCKDWKHHFSYNFTDLTPFNYCPECGSKLTSKKIEKIKFKIAYGNRIDEVAEKVNELIDYIEETKC